MKAIFTSRGTILFYLLLILSLPLEVFGQEAEEDQVAEEIGALSEDEEMELIDEFAFLEDAGMVESAARHRQEIGMSPSAVTVLTREDVEASGATTLPDLLRLVPGMDVTLVSPSYYSLGSRLQWTDSNNYYQLLIDGRDCINELLGQVPWLLELISLDDIERIEILRGPASSMYGASALAGVVSVTTRVVPKRTSASVRFEAGEVGMLQVGGRASTRIGNWGFSVSGGTDLANSFSQPRIQSKRMWKVRALAEYAWSETERLRVDFGISQGHGELNSAAGMVDIGMGLRALRVAYESKDLKSRIYWMNSPAEFTLEAPLEFQGIRLATFAPIESMSNTVDGEVQWTLPTFWDPLLVMVGGGGRFSWIGSDDLLDGETYADISNPEFHEPGISHWEVRGGAFVHSELKPAEWATISGSLRFDYNTETDIFLSPRMVAIFRPIKGQYMRMGLSRAFRKPAFIDTRLHPRALFPDDSPITGPDQENFQEFMSRMIGNHNLKNEELLSFEAGYLGQFLDGKLSVAVNFYFTQLRKLVAVSTDIVPTSQGLPDLDQSVIRSKNEAGDLDINGYEVVVHYDPVKSVSLLASWTYREVFNRKESKIEEGTPKNLVTLGGRFRSESGLVGSLYVFSRSDITDDKVENPEGLLADPLSMRIDTVFLVMGKLGYGWITRQGFELEFGAKLFLPVSPFSSPYFRYYEDPGGLTPGGDYYGGHYLRRMVTAYLQGSF
jgi:iron complex outermembrane receptor protein